MADEKPIDQMLKGELVVEVKARIKEVEMLKELIVAMGTPPTQPKFKKRWAVYDRMSL